MTTQTSTSAERFAVTYRFTGPAEAAKRNAWALAIEQTVELPEELVPAGPIREHVFGRIESLTEQDAQTVDVTISYATETAGGELTQLLNVIFGNSSLIPNIRVIDLQLPDGLLSQFQGPRYGIPGLRSLLGVPERPLLCTALKPLGLSAAELAELAYRCALGGMDLIKDDHGLANQSYAPFAERVARCAEAVARANKETGENCLYVANISAPAHLIAQQAKLAKDAGVGGLMIAPGLTGQDSMRMLADDERLGLPILSHPAFQGGFVNSQTSGIAHGVIFGTLARLAGADATIFPNDGGRFQFTPADCQAIAEASKAPLGKLAPIFPVPAGGMSVDRAPELVARYGHDVMLLMGGSLLRAGKDLPKAARALRTAVEL